jgi:hypothetical protein
LKASGERVRVVVGCGWRITWTVAGGGWGGVEGKGLRWRHLDCSWRLVSPHRLEPLDVECWRVTAGEGRLRLEHQAHVSLLGLG